MTHSLRQVTFLLIGWAAFGVLTSADTGRYSVRVSRVGQDSYRAGHSDIEIRTTNCYVFVTAQNAVYDSSLRKLSFSTGQVCAVQGLFQHSSGALAAGTSRGGSVVGAALLGALEAYNSARPAPAPDVPADPRLAYYQARIAPAPSGWTDEQVLQHYQREIQRLRESGQAYPGDNVASQPASSMLGLRPAKPAVVTETLFRGKPEMKVSEGGIERTLHVLASSEATNLLCVISRIGDKYYWASRENVELVAMEAGAYVTFVAANGSGYVRVLLPALKEAAAAGNPTESKFDYVEHILLGLRSITYYGQRDQ